MSDSRVLDHADVVAFVEPALPIPSRIPRDGSRAARCTPASNPEGAEKEGACCAMVEWGVCEDKFTDDVADAIAVPGAESLFAEMR